MTFARCSLLAFLIASPPAQQGPQAPPLGEEAERLGPGFTVTYRAKERTDIADARMAALFVPEGSPPSPFLPPGPFQAVFEGLVSVDLGTDCTFSAQGTGAVQVTVNGKPALVAKGPDLSKTEGKSVLLKKGKNKLVMTYQSPEKGDAWVRLSWVSSDFPQEPVGPQAAVHVATARDLRLQRRVREGRELFALRRCGKCHATGIPKGGMPELEMDAPSLAEAGARLRREWIEKWVQGPRAIRPEATMPHLSGIGPEQAADLAAYLSTLGQPGTAPPADPELAKSGGTLFAELRCIGCHTLPENPPAPDRIPYTFLAAKFAPASLVQFLLAPDKHYAWIEMPNFRLSPEEASRLAQFLLSRKGEAIPPSGRAGDPGRGKTLVETSGCLACHQGPGTNQAKAPALREIPPEGWSRGCLAEKGSGKAPDFGLGERERGALLAFLSTDLSSLSREAHAEFAERQVRWLRCQACHKRDGEHDRWADLASETKHLLPPKKESTSEFVEVAPPDPVIPSLTWIGEKLKPEWAVAFLRGEVKDRPRPFLNLLRMPSFTSRAEALIRGFAYQHGYPAVAVPEAEPNAELVPVGRKLSGPNGGLDCLSCHAIGPRAATKVFEAPAPNFKFVRSRIRRDYFERWVRSPLRVEPGTKMPQFFQDGRTQLTEILDGDAGRQIDALWQYLLEGEKIRPPQE
jgi:mono/diheme cytochrome c family protein